MPFTPAHTAAAIPFLRTRLVSVALVIGCMAPDFEYFLRLKAGGPFGHTLRGIFLFDLPVSLVALWLFHACIKQPLYTWMPEAVRRRIRLGPSAWPVKSLADFVLVSLSILVGVATHFLWDSITHRSFWPYRHWEFLHQTVQVPVYGSLEYLRVIQHLSTLFGITVLLFWFRNWYRSTAPVKATESPIKHRYFALGVVCLVATIAGCVLGFASSGVPEGVDSAKTFAIKAVITAITFFWVGVVAYGAYLGRLTRI